MKIMLEHQVKNGKPNQIIIIAFFMFLFCFSCKAPLEDIDEIWGIRSLEIKEGIIVLTFDTAIPLGPAGFRNNNGTIGKVIPYENYEKPVEIEVGQTIFWGDGDHIFFSLRLITIIDNHAIVEVTEEHRPPPGHQDLKYNRIQKYRTNGYKKK